MAKLKLDAVPDDKTVKITVELPAATHRDLLAYAEAIGRQSGQPIIDPSRLIAPMISKFMSTDRAFIKMRRLEFHLSRPNCETQKKVKDADKPVQANSSP